MQKIQVKGQLAQKLELKQSDGHDRLQYPAHWRCRQRRTSVVSLAAIKDTISDADEFYLNGGSRVSSGGRPMHDVLHVNYRSAVLCLFPQRDK